VLIPPLGTIAGAALGLALLGTALALAGWVTPAAAMWAAGPLMILLLHVARGVTLSGLGLRGWTTLALAPAYLVWKVSLRLRKRPDANQWVRTDRESAADRDSRAP
jgi:hypothetical protein